MSRAAALAKISRQTWNGVEDGSRETLTYNYGPIERVLGWAPGSIDAVLGGGDPVELDGAEADSLSDEDAGNADAVIRAIVEVLDSSISASTKLKLIEGLIANDYRPSRPARSEDGRRGEAAAS